MQKIIRVQSNNPKEKAHLEKLLSEGWTIKSLANQSQGYGCFKTCCWGWLFLPLALLGKKPDIMEYVLEKEDKEPKEKAHNKKGI